MLDSLGFVVPPVRPAIDSSPGRRLGWARRNLKFAVAIALLGVGAYSVLSGQGYVATDNAVVSAYTLSLRAPITGYLSGLHTNVGDTIGAGTLLARLNEPRVDDQRLVDLENLLARYRSQQQAYGHERDQLSLQRAALVQRAAERNRAETDFLGLQAAEAERQVNSRVAVRDYVRRDFSRKDLLGRTGTLAAADVDKAHSAADQATHDVDAGIARLAYLRVQTEAARNGMLLENGSNDVPYSSQRADEIEIRLAEIEREIANLSAAQAETVARHGAEQRRIELLRSADLIAPATGRLWKLAASDGERLSVGDTAAELVDCGSAFIVATIPQDRYPDIEIGGAARVRLSGEKADRVGRVVSVTGEATLANDRNLASAPLVQSSATATVRVAVTTPDNAAGECLVGRTARVLLPTSAGSGLLSRLTRRYL